MFSNRLTFAALAAACITAAGVGGYFASRQNTVPTPASAAEASLSTTDTTAVDHPVQETEAVIGDSAPAASGTAPGHAYDHRPDRIVAHAPRQPERRRRRSARRHRHR